MLAAQFPGSINPTVTNTPVPRYLRKFLALRLGLCVSFKDSIILFDESIFC